MKRGAFRVCGAIFGLSAAAAALSQTSPTFARLWTRFIAAYVDLVSRAGAPFSAPLMEVLGVAAAACLSFSALRALALRQPGRLLRPCAALAALLASGYLALWYPLYFAPAAQAAPAQADVQALRTLSEALVDRLAPLEGATVPPRNIPRLAAQALEALDELPLPATHALPKAAQCPDWLRALRLAGLFSPWTSEAIYAPDLPAAAQPFTACHELAHLRGVADEGQANIAAFRACMSAEPGLQRSAYLHALARALPRLYRLDRAAWTTCVARLDARILSDLRAMGGLTGSGRSSPPGWLLRALGIESSAQNYDALLDFLAAAGLDG